MFMFVYLYKLSFDDKVVMNIVEQVRYHRDGAPLSPNFVSLISVMSTMPADPSPSVQVTCFAVH